MPQVIYDDDPPETKGRHGAICDDAFAVAETMFEKHPQLSCVVLTLVLGDDPETPSQNAVCFRKDIRTDAKNRDKRIHQVVVEAMRAMLRLAKQIETGSVGTEAAAGIATMPDIIIPPRLARRPRDHRGFIVPYFVQWFDEAGAPIDEPTGLNRLSPQPEDGVPDFRVIDHNRMAICVNEKRCWICGDKLGVHLAFVLGPMCTINKLISEPPSHKECAEYAVKVCPFMTHPRMRRNDKNLPEHEEAGGLPNERNPGIMAIWITRSYTPFRPHAGHDGTLFRVGPYEQVTWWKEGRRATRIEAEDALVDGYELLKVEAEKEGPKAVRELDRMALEADRTVPP